MWRPECASHGQTLTIQTPKTVLLGDMLLAGFDLSAQYNADSRERSRLATLTATLTASLMLKHAPTVMTSLSRLGSDS